MVQVCLSSEILFRAQTANLPRTFCRSRSIRAAIERGIQQSEGGFHRKREQFRPSQTADHLPLRSSRTNTERPVNFRSVTRQSPRSHSSRNGWRGDRSPRQKPFVSTKQRVPDTLPYTTAASEFLYGHSAVLAALRSGRRGLYNLYVHTRGQNHEGHDNVVVRAREKGIAVHEVNDAWLPVLDKASSGRPHNGFVLEASPLPRPPITQLGATSKDEEYWNVVLDAQSKEDVKVNGTTTRYEYKSKDWRYPFLLYVDGVLDEGNLGAIARSAYFLGVDAIATPTRQSAPWSHIALKASAGAAESIPIFTVNKPTDFLSRSARDGWKTYASDAIPLNVAYSLASSASPSSAGGVMDSNIVYTFAKSNRRIPDHHPLAEHPSILMMGAEGNGLRASLLSQAHYRVGILAGREVDEIGVDSLNVSVAASLLCYDFLQKPKANLKPGDLLF